MLICDGFGTHETLEILEYCFENNIILCRLPSHTSHKLQPCDVSVFAPLKTAYRVGSHDHCFIYVTCHVSTSINTRRVASFIQSSLLPSTYRDQVERLNRGGINTVGKEHFTYLYAPVRERALTKRNIVAGWAATGLFPFSPERVLRNTP